MNINTACQTDLVSIFNLLPAYKQQELIYFALFLWRKKQEDEKNPADPSLKTVEETWGIIDLPRHIMKDIAENRENDDDFDNITWLNVFKPSDI